MTKHEFVFYYLLGYNPGSLAAAVAAYRRFKGHADFDYWFSPHIGV